MKGYFSNLFILGHKNRISMHTKIKLVVIGILSACWLLPVAQNTDDILSSEKLIGKNLITNRDIVGKEFIFPERIEHTYLDTISNCMTVELRGLFMGGKLLKNNGDFMLYDLSNRKTKWIKGMNYQNNFIEQHGNFIFKTSLNKTYCLDFETGENLWKAKKLIAFVNPYLKIGVGYTPFPGYILNDDFEGVDLNNGNTLWKRKLNYEDGLNEIFMINDSVAMVVASGLHTINLKDGKGWDYNAKTGARFGNAKITEIRSNVLMDSVGFYFASQEKIVRLDHTGYVLWSCTLPKELTSNSQILFMDSTLFMINTGSASIGTSQFKQGKPYIAAFNPETGKKVFLSTVDDRRGKMVNCVIEKDEILILFKDRIANCSVLTGALIGEKKFDSRKYGDIDDFLSNKVFFRNDSIYTSLALSDTINRYVVTTKGKIVVINPGLEVVREYEKDQLYRYYLRYQGLRFLSKGNNTIVIDRNNKIVATLETSRHAQKIGSKLYQVGEKSVLEIELKQLNGN